MKKFQHVVYCQFAIGVEVEVCGSASRIKPHFTHIYPRRATIKQFPSFEHHCPVLMPKVDDVNEVRWSTETDTSAPGATQL